MAQRAKTHKVILTVSFDKAVTRANATRAVRDCIVSDVGSVGPWYYPTVTYQDDPGEFRVHGVKPAPVP